MTVALAATALVSAQAQSEFKPLAGSVTTDFSLFANGIFNQTESPVALGSHAGINAGLIKGRYFLQDNIALRLSLGLNNSSSTQKTTDPVTEATTRATSSPSALVSNTTSVARIASLPISVLSSSSVLLRAL